MESQKKPLTQLLGFQLMTGIEQPRCSGCPQQVASGFWGLDSGSNYFISSRGIHWMANARIIYSERGLWTSYTSDSYNKSVRWRFYSCLILFSAFASVSASAVDGRCRSCKIDNRKRKNRLPYSNGGTGDIACCQVTRVNQI